MELVQPSNFDDDTGYLKADGSVVGATSQAQAFTNGVITGKIYPSADSTTAVQINKANGTTNVLNIDTTNSRVGIGMTNPGAALDVSGQVQSSLGFNISSYNTLLTQNKLQLYGANGFIMSSDSTGNLSFGHEVSGTPNYTGAILNNGNVGIGTTSPSQLLSVGSSSQFTVNSSGAFSAGANSSISGGLSVNSYVVAGGNYTMSVGGLRTLSSGNGVEIGRYNGSTNGTFTASTGSQAGIALFNTVNQSGSASFTDLLLNSTETTTGSGGHNLLDLQTGGTSRFLVQSGGNVGIGTTSPGSLLDVNGATTATSSNNYSSGAIRTTGNYWNGTASASDYWTIQNVLGTGTNPTSTLTIGHTGSTGQSAINLNARTTLGGTLILKNYTVSTLPTGVTGMLAYVTDALAPTYGATVVGGGTVVTPVFYDGTNWTCR